jgi:hypothetical protein
VTKPRIAGLALSVISGEMLLWSISGLQRAAYCGTPGHSVCPDDRPWLAAGDLAGILMLVLGAILTLGIGILVASSSTGATAFLLAATGAGDSRIPYFAVGALCSGLPTLVLTAKLIMRRVGLAVGRDLPA